MLHATAIEDALAASDLSTLERAFRALVAFPDAEPIEGVKTVETLCALLARVIRALQHDSTAMAPGLEAIIAAAAGYAIDAPATYAAGAAAAAAHQYHWRGVYLQHAANAGHV